MSDETTPEEPAPADEPIDADFEPASDDSPGSGAPGVLSGPGWMGAIVLSLVAAALGGIFGVAGMRYLPPDWDAANDMTGRVETLERRQGDANVELSRLGRAQTQMANDIREEMKTAGTGAGNGEAVRALRAEVETLSERLDGALAEGGGSVSALERRVEALEEVDTSGAVSPQELTRAVAGLETRLEDMEQRAEIASGADPEALAALEEEVADLRADLKAARLAGNQDTERLTRLIEEMREGEQAARTRAEEAAETADLARAVSAIEAASRRGGGFESEYRALRALRPDDPVVRQLAPIAAEGAPTVASLQDSFPAAKADAVKAIPEAGGTGLSWLNRAFGDAVKVRRTDGAETGPAALLDAAGEAVEAGDLRAALEQVALLEGAPAEAMSGWTARANRRITLEDALEALQLRLIEGDN